MRKSIRTVVTTALLGTMGMMSHVACEPTEGPSAQSNNVEEETCRVPRVLFVVDASASMLEPIAEQGAEDGAGQTKWEALAGAVDALTEAHDGTALFGLMTFPGTSGGCTPGDMLIEPGPYQEDAINQVIGELPIAADAATPAGQTLMLAAQNEQLLDPSYDNYVVFISDGWQYCNLQSEGAPGCAAPADYEAMGVDGANTCNACQINDSSPACQGQNADGCYCVRSWPVLGVQALRDAGVKTYVVGFGENVDALTLNQAAQVGGDPLPDCDPNSEDPSCFLNAGSPSELTAALDKVMLRVTRQPCEGGCGIPGKRTCTLEGWSACQAPEQIECASECGTEGIQQCVDGSLSECSATCDPDVDPSGSGGSGQGGSAQGGSSQGGSAQGGSAQGGSGQGGGDNPSEGQGGAGGGDDGIGGWPGGGDDWDDGDDWEDDDWYDDGELPSGEPETGGGAKTPESDGGCSYAPRRQSPGSFGLIALGLALAATRRRRR
jgi:hypothetical protein